MTGLPAILSGMSSALLLLLAAIHILSGRRNSQRTTFILSTLCGGAAMLFLTLALVSETPEEVMQLLQIHLALMIFSPVLGIPFFLLFGRGEAKTRLRGMLPGMLTLGILLTTVALVLPIELVVERFQIAEGGGLWRIGVTFIGRLLAMHAMAVNVLLLHAFENTYRAATVPAKVTLKYPLLGAIAATILNFTMMSRIILLSEIDGYFVSFGVLGLIFFCMTFLYTGARYPLFEVDTVLEKGRESSVVTVVVAGLYMLALALITWASNLVGMPYETFGIAVLAVFALFIILAVLISGKARRRLRRFFNENFRPGIYNYRREWRHYARLMTSSTTVEDLLSNTISSLCETIMVKKGFIYTGIGTGKSADYGLEINEVAAASSGKLMELYDGSPLVLFRAHRRHGPAQKPMGTGNAQKAQIQDWMRVAAFLIIGGEVKGIIALGQKDFGMGWTAEDRNFLSTIADQASLALENLLMEERHLESKQLESFNRFASFVIHDLKNTVGMLSLTAENARDNIHDREFQEDAIDTVERSVEKMRRLIDSLNAHKAPLTISRSRVDLAAEAAGKIAALERLAAKKGVSVGLDTGDGASAFVDASAVSRIIENLVLNSIEAAVDGGSVDVRIERSGKDLKIVVSDDGPGFDLEYMEDGLFRPFMSTKKSGLGVGLVLCKSLTEAHGGSISVSSRPGAGASVEVRLPAEE